MTILAIDAGTTGVTAQLIDTDGLQLGRGYCEVEQHFPQPGWVEHEPEQIWQATLESVRGALAAAKSGPESVSAIGLTNQRETVALWDRASLQSPTRAIVWQDRRTATLLHEAKFAQAGGWVRELTGLPLDPYFSSSKLLWIKRNLPEIWAGVESGATAVGTIDSYLVARITGGTTHITDASNASRTQLFNIHSLSWDENLLELFEIPEAALPRVVANFGHLADSSPAAFQGISAPVTGMAGDQQAALFGQLAFAEGEAKCTYGTGAFLLRNTGKRVVAIDPKLISTVAWMDAGGQPTYALEGSVFNAGSAIQWLRDGLEIIDDAGEIDTLAASAGDNGGVCVVPAFTGLGAPFWDAEVRAAILGITRGTSRAQIARATLEAIAFQVRALVEAMDAAVGEKLSTLKVDGGATRSQLLMQLQASALNAEILLPANFDTTGLGAAFMAGLGAGIWTSTDELHQSVAKRFEPNGSLDAEYARWLRAVSAARGF